MIVPLRHCVTNGWGRAPPLLQNSERNAGCTEDQGFSLLLLLSQHLGSTKERQSETFYINMRGKFEVGLFGTMAEKYSNST